MKLLVAVRSSLQEADAGFHQDIRDTWGKDFGLKADVKFFMAQDIRNRVRDEVQLTVSDRVEDNPLKVMQIATWMIGKTYDYAFICTTKTFLKPALLLKSGFEKYDYSGFVSLGRISTGEQFPYVDEKGGFWPGVYPWADASTGYFLSRRAALEISAEGPRHWRDDISVGQILGPEIAKAQLTAEDIGINGVASWKLPEQTSLKEEESERHQPIDSKNTSA